MLHENIHVRYKDVKTNPRISPRKIIGTTEICSSGQVSDSDNVIDFYINYFIHPAIKQQIKNYRTTDIQNRIQSFQLNNDRKSWRTLKKEMGYPSKGSSYPGLTNGTSIAKTDGDKLKLFAEQPNSVFATKIDLKDKNLEREIWNVLILNVQDYSSLKSVDDHEELISVNELDRIIKNLDIKKAPGLDCINNKLIKYLKPALLKFPHFFFNLRNNFGTHPTNWKIAKVIILHKACKPEDLTGSYRPLSLTSFLGKLLDKAVAETLAIGQKLTKNLINNKTVSEKIGAQTIIYLNLLKQLNLFSVRVTQRQEYFLMSRKPSTKYGMMAFFLS